MLATQPAGAAQSNDESTTEDRPECQSFLTLTIAYDDTNGVRHSTPGRGQ